MYGDNVVPFRPRMNAMNPLLGIGIYSVSDASRLTGVPVDRVRRWLRGYRRQGEARAPVVTAQIGRVEGHLALGFLDLMEVRFIDHFLRQGVKWPTLKRAAREARTTLGHAHPFAMRQFISDGVAIFEHVAQKTGDTVLCDMVSQQMAFPEILKSLLGDGIAFDEDGAARTWHPDPTAFADVILDPERSFGRPILDQIGVPTGTLHDAWKGGRTVAEIADWFEIEPRLVQEAVDFEEKLAA